MQIFFCGGGGGFWGCLGRPTPPPGGRTGSENDTLIPMTMTCDWFKFWSGPGLAVKSENKKYPFQVYLIIQFM